MKKFFKFIGTLILIAILFGAAYVASTARMSENGKTLIASYYDGGYLLEVYKVGDAEFPFGDTNCKFVLSSDDETVLTYDFTVANDGKDLDKNNFRVKWEEKRAVVTVMGEEQEDKNYNLYYDGTVITVVD